MCEPTLRLSLTRRKRFSISSRDYTLVSTRIIGLRLFAVSSIELHEDGSTQGSFSLPFLLSFGAFRRGKKRAN